MTHVPFTAILGAVLAGLVATGCSSGGGGGGGSVAGAPTTQQAPSTPSTLSATNNQSPVQVQQPSSSNESQTSPSEPAPATPAPPPAPTPPPAPPPPAPVPPPAPGSPAFTPSPGTQTIHVSSSTGDDTNPGTEALPVRTIAAGRALLRDGQPDWLLLKKGDTFTGNFLDWRLSGASAAAPMVIWSYGTGARPLLQTGAAGGISTSSSSAPQSTSFLVFSGLHFQAHTRIPNTPAFTGTTGSSGIRWLRGTTNLLIDDCVFQSYTNGMNISNYFLFGQSGITIRRCLLLDSYSTTAHSQGMYVDDVSGIVIEENIFDHNGWNEALSAQGAEPTIFNHAMYIQSNSTNVTVRKNIVLRSSSHGIQLRPGGSLTENVFIRNPISIQLGGNSKPLPGGIDAVCTGNLVAEGSDITPSLPRGWGIYMSNVKSAVVNDNTVVNLFTTNLLNAKAIFTDANATYANNTVWNWTGSPTFDSLGPFANPNVSAAAYNGAQGGPATFDGFIATLRAQSRDSYNPAFSADAIRAYFAEGFSAP